MKKQTLTRDKNIMKDHNNEKLIPILADAARTLSSCAENIQEIAEHIIYSCDDIADTKRMDYVSIPHIRTDELRELATTIQLGSQAIEQRCQEAARR